MADKNDADFPGNGKNKFDRSYAWPVVPAFKSRPETDEEILWRMKGFLDCLRHQAHYGPVDPLYIEYLVEKTGEKCP